MHRKERENRKNHLNVLLGVKRRALPILKPNPLLVKPSMKGADERKPSKRKAVHDENELEGKQRRIKGRISVCLLLGNHAAIRSSHLLLLLLLLQLGLQLWKIAEPGVYQCVLGTDPHLWS